MGVTVILTYVKVTINFAFVCTSKKNKHMKK